jgi:predicted nucleotidyltransferase
VWGCNVVKEHEVVIEKLCTIAKPKKLILYGSKIDVATGDVKDIDVCLVVETENKAELERELYLAIDSDVSFDIIIYTPSEWEVLITDAQSFAHRILEKGTVIYECQA